MCQALGSKANKADQCHLVGRNDRNDLSIFRIGINTSDRFIVNEQYIYIPSVTYFRNCRVASLKIIETVPFLIDKNFAIIL